MERHFDAHLYLANWGTRRIALRLEAPPAPPSWTCLWQWNPIGWQFG